MAHRTRLFVQKWVYIYEVREYIPDTGPTGPAREGYETMNTQLNALTLPQLADLHNQILADLTKVLPETAAHYKPVTRFADKPKAHTRIAYLKSLLGAATPVAPVAPAPKMVLAPLVPADQEAGGDAVMAHHAAKEPKKAPPRAKGKTQTRQREVAPASAITKIRTGTTQAAVLNLLDEGKWTVDQIAGKANTSPREVRHHLYNLAKKGAGHRTTDGIVSAVYPDGVKVADFFLP